MSAARIYGINRVICCVGIFMQTQRLENVPRIGIKRGESAGGRIIVSCPEVVKTDVGIQLRTYDLGQYSAALADCIAAGLPTITTQGLADALDAPSYVTRLPSRFNAFLVAERMADVLESGRTAERQSAARTVFLMERNFERYASALIEAIEAA